MGRVHEWGFNELCYIDNIHSIETVVSSATRPAPDQPAHQLMRACPPTDAHQLCNVPCAYNPKTLKPYSPTTLKP
eukprot:560492-Prorocentrum_minimum.AAC.1